MITMDTPKIVNTDITPDPEGGFLVRGTWGGVELDRTDSIGYLVKDMRTARRLSAAMLAGAIFVDATVKVDVNGNRYVAGASKVLGRTMNADLRRLGF